MSTVQQVPGPSGDRVMSRLGVLLAIAAAVFVGAALLGVRVPGVVVAGWLFAVPIYASLLVIAQNDRRVVLPVLVPGMLLRIAIGAVVLTFFHTQLFDVFKDTGRYENIGKQIADAWNAGVALDLFKEYALSVAGYYYVVAGLDRLAGHNELLVVVFNAAVAVVGALLVYALATRLAVSRAARLLAVGIAMLTPSVVFWGSIPLKDTLVSALILAGVLACLSLVREPSRSVAALALLCVASLAVSTLRLYATFFLTLGTLVVVAFTGLWRSRPAWAAAVVVSVILVQLYTLQGPVGTQLQTSIADPAEIARLRDVNSGGGSGDADEVGSFLPSGGESRLERYAGLIIRAPVFIALYFALPIPFVTQGRLVPLALPEMPFWYAAIIAAIFGLILLWRRDQRLGAALIVIIVLAMAFLDGAVVSNAGTMIRQRAPAIELLAVPIAVGVVRVVELLRSRTNASRAQ